MKKLGIFLFVVSFLAFSCEKVDYLEVDFTDPEDGQGIISINVSSVDSNTYQSHTTATGETIFPVEANKLLVFSYTASVEVDYQIWVFWDGQESDDKEAIYFYSGYNMKPLSLLVVDIDGNTYQVDVYLDLFPRYPASPFIITSVEASGDKWNVIAAVYKNAWYDVTGNYYKFGTVTDDPWQNYDLITPIDTNYRMSADNNLYSAQGVGHWIKAEMTIATGEHSLALVRFDNDDPIWGNFKGSMFVADNQTLIEFSLTSDGQIIPVLSLPGQGGDIGSAAVVRFDIDDDIIIYVNLEANFSSHDPWWSYLDHNEEWIEEPLLSVLGFPNWGKFYMDAGDLPLKMIFGKNPGEIAGNMSQSIFWDEYFQYLYLYFQNMQT